MQQSSFFVEKKRREILNAGRKVGAISRTCVISFYYNKVLTICRMNMKKMDSDSIFAQCSRFGSCFLNCLSLKMEFCATCHYVAAIFLMVSNEKLHPQKTL